MRIRQTKKEKVRRAKVGAAQKSVRGIDKLAREGLHAGDTQPSAEQTQTSVGAAQKSVRGIDKLARESLHACDTQSGAEQTQTSVGEQTQAKVGEQTQASSNALLAGDGTEALAASLPPDSVVGVLACDEGAAREYASRLRRRKLGSRRVTPSVESADADVRALVAIGGEREAEQAKACAARWGIPLYVVAVSGGCSIAVPNRTEVREGIARVVSSPAPVGIAVAPLCDARAELPAVFGGICAAAFGIFDCEASCRVLGLPCDSRVTADVFDAVYRALDAANSMPRSSDALPPLLAEISAKLSLLSVGAYDFVRASTDDCARTAAALLQREERAVLPRGELAYLFGAALCSLAGEMLSPRRCFLPPPDNNLRAERLTEYLGLDEFSAATEAVCRLPVPAALAAYRIGEYADELSDTLRDVRAVFAESKRLFRRLHADDGYRLRGYLDAADFRTVLALAPDLYPTQVTTLTVMRELGYLERYLD